MGRETRRQPVNSRRNCGPERLFGDTDLGLPSDKVSFTSETPQLSRGDLEYSMPMPASRTPRTLRGQRNEASEEVKTRGGVLT